MATRYRVTFVIQESDPAEDLEFIYESLFGDQDAVEVEKVEDLGEVQEDA